MTGVQTCALPISSFLVLGFDCLVAAPLLDLFLVHTHAGDELSYRALIALEARRCGVDLGFQLQGRSGVLVFAHVERSRALGQTDNDKAAERVDATRERLIQQRDTEAQRR